MTIFLKGKLEVLRYIVEQMAVRTKDAVFVDTTENDFFLQIFEMDSEIDENTHVITLNNAGVNLLLEGGENYWELKNVKLHNIQVDPPIFYKSTLDLQLNCMQIVTVDGYHNQFVKHYYPVYQNSIFVPLGGARDAEHIKKYEEREIEILFLGGLQGAEEQQFEIPMLADKGKGLHEMAMQLMTEDPNLSVETFMEAYFQAVEPGLTEQVQLICIYAVYRDVVRAIRGMYQEKIIETLALAGIPVTIYSGGGWHKLGEAYPGIVTVKERVSFAECVGLIGNSKICLNIQPWFKYGAHDRVYNAMLNEVVCVTDISEYLVQHFTHGQDIIFYELNRLDKLVEDVKYVLANPDYAKMIIHNQKQRAVGQTWADRLEEIIGSCAVEGKKGAANEDYNYFRTADR